MLWPIKISNQHASTADVLKFYETITYVLSTAAKETIPFSKCNKDPKPYWTHTVKEHRREMSFCRSMWIGEGSLRGMTFSTFKEYKKAKDKFRTNLEYER